MTLIAKIVVLDSPASFRNTYDASMWRGQLNSEFASGVKREVDLFGVAEIALPVKMDLSMKIYHFYDKKTTLRDTDNMAKPVMDAFNKVIYADDVQVRSLRFESLPFFSKRSIRLLERNGFLRALVQGPMMRISGSIGNDCTVVIIRTLGEGDDPSDSPRFLMWDMEHARTRVG